MSTWERIQESILPGVIPADGMLGEAKWFAVQTRARHEKKVGAYLKEKGIESFLPLCREEHQWSDRRRMVDLPMFSGFLFVHIPDTPSARRSVLATPGVCWFVGDHGMGHPIPDKQIQDLQTILNSAVPYTPFPFVGMGQRIRVHGGCLEGIEGTLICTESDPTVVVSVETVRRSLAVRVNGYDLEEV